MFMNIAFGRHNRLSQATEEEVHDSINLGMLRSAFERSIHDISTSVVPGGLLVEDKGLQLQGSIAKHAYSHYG